MRGFHKTCFGFLQILCSYHSFVKEKNTYIFKLLNMLKGEEIAILSEKHCILRQELVPSTYYVKDYFGAFHKYQSNIIGYRSGKIWCVIIY